MKYISCFFHWTIPTGKIFWVEVFEKRMKYISCLFHWTIPTGKICLVNKQVILIAFTQLSKSKHINDNTSFSHVSCGLIFFNLFVLFVILRWTNSARKNCQSFLCPKAFLLCLLYACFEKYSSYVNFSSRSVETIDKASGRRAGSESRIPLVARPCFPTIAPTDQEPNQPELTRAKSAGKRKFIVRWSVNDNRAF